jgi:hypothetical protein
LEVSERVVTQTQTEYQVPQFIMTLITHSMSCFASRTASLALLVAALLNPTSVFGQLANWDDLVVPAAYEPTPAGYHGHNWYFGDAAFGLPGPDDGDHGLLQYSSFVPSAVTPPSGDNAAYNAWGNTPMRIESLTTDAADAFTFTGWFSAQGYPDPSFPGSIGASQILVQGFVGGSSTPAFETTFSISSAWLEESFNTTPVNKLLFSPLDGAGAPCDFIKGYFYLDDVTITPVPEPATWAFASVLACGVFAMVRRHRVS